VSSDLIDQQSEHEQTKYVNRYEKPEEKSLDLSNLASALHSSNDLSSISKKDNETNPQQKLNMKYVINKTLALAK